MSVTVNPGMVDQIAGSDGWSDSTITFSINVDPGNFLQVVLDAIGFPVFSPVVSQISGDETHGEFAQVIKGFALWDDLIRQKIEYVADDDDADITVNKVLICRAIPAG